ncbi:transcriptional regulator AraC family protein [Firmicutes bacterium CAG:170]|nr:transcriptional regulator AraC family protein [Firmicutes bacterium CAG:170]
MRSVGFGRSIQQYITAIYDARGQSVWSRTQMLGYAYLLLGKLVEGQSEPENRSDCVEKAAEFLSNNYADQITIDDAAAFAGVSRSWLYRGFQRRYGKSPLAYLEELRMQYAAQLLRTTALRVNEIACSVGYLDALYFSRAFSRRMGLSPTAYRAADLPSGSTEA